jgi:HK97 family phage prohead protease
LFRSLRRNVEICLKVRSIVKKEENKMEKVKEGEQEIFRIKMVNEVLTEKDYEGKALGELEIEMIGSTESMDRDGEVIEITAWDLKQYKKNPVILPQHNYSRPAIGKAKDVKITDGKLMFKIEFPEEGVNPEADTYRKLYKAGFMNASSVGFIPKEWVDGDGKKQPFRKFTKVELLELSLVSVPSNPTALMTAKSKGLVSDEELKSIGFEEELEVKGDDPNMLLNDNHMKMHEEIKAFIDMATTKFAFIDGFITASKEATVLEQKSETHTISYISELLRGESKAKSNESSSTGLTEVLKEVSLKNTLKGE